MRSPIHQPSSPAPAIIIIIIGSIVFVKLAGDVDPSWAAPALIACALGALGLFKMVKRAGHDPAIEESADIYNLMPGPQFYDMRLKYADLVDHNGGIWKWKPGWSKARFIREVYQ
jgi:hypothetical protein